MKTPKNQKKEYFSAPDTLVSDYLVSNSENDDIDFLLYAPILKNKNTNHFELEEFKQKFIEKRNSLPYLAHSCVYAVPLNSRNKKIKNNFVILLFVTVIAFREKLGLNFYSQQILNKIRLTANTTPQICTIVNYNNQHSAQLKNAGETLYKKTSKHYVPFATTSRGLLSASNDERAPRPNQGFSTTVNASSSDVSRAGQQRRAQAKATAQPRPAATAAVARVNANSRLTSAKIARNLRNLMFVMESPAMTSAPGRKISLTILQSNDLPAQQLAAVQGSIDFSSGRLDNSVPAHYAAPPQCVNPDTEVISMPDYINQFFEECEYKNKGVSALISEWTKKEYDLFQGFISNIIGTKHPKFKESVTEEKFNTLTRDIVLYQTIKYERFSLKKIDDAFHSIGHANYCLGKNVIDETQHQICHSRAKDQLESLVDSDVHYFKFFGDINSSDESERLMVREGRRRFIYVYSFHLAESLGDTVIPGCAFERQKAHLSSRAIVGDFKISGNLATLDNFWHAVTSDVEQLMCPWSASGVGGSNITKAFFEKCKNVEQTRKDVLDFCGNNDSITRVLFPLINEGDNIDWATKEGLQEGLSHVKKLCKVPLKDKDVNFALSLFDYTHGQAEQLGAAAGAGHFLHISADNIAENPEARVGTAAMGSCVGSRVYSSAVLNSFLKHCHDENPSLFNELVEKIKTRHGKLDYKYPVQIRQGILTETRDFINVFAPESKEVIRILNEGLESEKQIGGLPSQPIGRSSSNSGEGLTPVKGDNSSAGNPNSAKTTSNTRKKGTGESKSKESRGSVKGLGNGLKRSSRKDKAASAPVSPTQPDEKLLKKSKSAPVSPTQPDEKLLENSKSVPSSLIKPEDGGERDTSKPNSPETAP